MFHNFIACFHERNIMMATRRNSALLPPSRKDSRERREATICHRIYVAFMICQGCACHIKSFHTLFKNGSKLEHLSHILELGRLARRRRILKLTAPIKSTVASSNRRKDLFQSWIILRGHSSLKARQVGKTRMFAIVNKFNVVWSSLSSTLIFRQIDFKGKICIFETKFGDEICLRQQNRAEIEKNLFYLVRNAFC